MSTRAATLNGISTSAPSLSTACPSLIALLPPRQLLRASRWTRTHCSTDLSSSASITNRHSHCFDVRADSKGSGCRQRQALVKALVNVWWAVGVQAHLANVRRGQVYVWPRWRHIMSLLNYSQINLSPSAPLGHNKSVPPCPSTSQPLHFALLSRCRRHRRHSSTRSQLSALQCWLRSVDNPTEKTDPPVISASRCPFEMKPYHTAARRFQRPWRRRETSDGRPRQVPCQRAGSSAC